MTSVPDIWLVYDEGCRACRVYCTPARIRESAGHLVLVDAREGGPLMQEITAAGLDIDQGMVLKAGGNLHYGADAIHGLSLMDTNKGLFNRFTYQAFRSSDVSRVLYPLLRACRNRLPKAPGKTGVDNQGMTGNDRFQSVTLPLVQADRCDGSRHDHALRCSGCVTQASA